MTVGLHFFASKQQLSPKDIGHFNYGTSDPSLQRQDGNPLDEVCGRLR